MGDYGLGRLAYSPVMTFKPAIILRMLTTALVVFGSAAHADNVAIDTSTAPAMGKVVPGSATSTFTVDGSTGSVALATGNAVRFNSPGTISTPTVTVTCASPCNGNAANRTMTVTVTSTGSGRATITSFTRTNMSSGVTFNGNTTGSPLSFTILFPMGSGANTASFKLGMTVQVATSGATGLRSLPYQISTSRP